MAYASTSLLASQDPAEDLVAAQPSAVSFIDLRSDTLTRPTPEMRRAMAAAEVGDDVYGEDPTVNLLEKRAAEVFHREAAMFVPTGTMGNQIGLRIHTHHGQEIVCERRAHIMDWEMSMTAVFVGCQLRTVNSEDGILRWDHIAPALRKAGPLWSGTGLISLENTHNMAGGVVSPKSVVDEICHEAAKVNLPVHMDGARVFNAATALKTNVAELTAGLTTVMFCLSKGLGAPIGSMLVGSADLIARARIFRKGLGGGMRQAGILAAAGLIALEKMPLRLHEDHANAKLLAEAVAKIPGVELDPSLVHTNIVIFNIPSDPAPVLARLRQAGVLASAVGARSIRLVTHYDVDRAACLQAIPALQEALHGL